MDAEKRGTRVSMYVCVQGGGGKEGFRGSLVVFIHSYVCHNFPFLAPVPKLVSSLGHDRACNHEHYNSQELHDFTENKVKYPISCDWVHFGEDWVA